MADGGAWLGRDCGGSLGVAVGRGCRGVVRSWGGLAAGVAAVGVGGGRGGGQGRGGGGCEGGGWRLADGVAVGL